MTRDEVIATIRARQAALEAAGVRHVWLFGSVARDEAGPASDVDLFFDHDLPGFGLVDYARLKGLAADLLPFAVDFTHRASLHPAIRPRIEAEAVEVF